MTTLELPPAPSAQAGPVKAWRQPVVLPTYDVAPADKNPMFLEKRVYQGSSGKVYPLPFHDRISDTKIDREWDALHLENEFIRVMVLPQLGGRIHLAIDKTNGYDFIYRQNVIKPALVGLAGPWVSGGIEFNWPQHHRPATYLPADSYIDEHTDGSRTLWLSDHDPLTRMKGMHGVCLHPGRAVLEIKVRLYNRTPVTQTFLWWANIATRVHEQYQSFFPPDVSHVADHARRATSTFPLCLGHYYGVNYAARARDGVPAHELPSQYRPPNGQYAPNDLSWYANIPVPTSYMCTATQDDFFGGYDHAAKAGLVHVANHHIAPGKKQWTWGNHDFGYAWDRNLTDADAHGEHAPYIELMAGVFTDNQPDFSFLAPGETKTFSQFLYPIQQIGPAKQANERLALSVACENGVARVGICATEHIPNADITLFAKDVEVQSWQKHLAPGQPIQIEAALPPSIAEQDLRVDIRQGDHTPLIRFDPPPASQAAPVGATETPEPEQISSADELYTSGLHLAQYRHATRKPEWYWQEALRRDPEDSRCNTALGVWRLNRGELELAEAHFRTAIRRLTHRNANPYDGEPLYHLGLTLRLGGRDDDAYAVFYKATWNAAWRTPAFSALAQIDCARQDWPAALSHLDAALRTAVDHLVATNLKVVALRRLGRSEEADALLADTLSLDPLDWMARYLAGQQLACNTQTRLDVALDFMRAGLWEDARAILLDAAQAPDAGTAPLVQYYLGSVYARLGQAVESTAAYGAAAAAPDAYCFPARVEEIAILKDAIAANLSDARAHYYLGNLLYDRLRHEEAIRAWEAAVRLDPKHATTWRNLGIAYFNVAKDAARAADAYRRAVNLDPDDARLLFELDQLAKRMAVPPKERLGVLRAKIDLVRRRDDLSIEYCALLNLTGDHNAARDLLRSRHFQPWEGGEGLALGQHVRTHVALARQALASGQAQQAIGLLKEALASPPNLGEAKHLLANQSDVHYLLGIAYEADGDLKQAHLFWTMAAEKRGDFVGMAVQAYSEMTYYTILSLKRLGRAGDAEALRRGLAAFARTLLATPAKIDYFATSLPTMLLFDEDIEQTKNLTAQVMLVQAALANGDERDAEDLLRKVLEANPSHALAVDLFSGIGK